MVHGKEEIDNIQQEVQAKIDNLNDQLIL